MNRLYDRIDRELPGIALKYGLSESAELEEVIGYLENFARMYGIEFVHGSGKRKNCKGTANGLRIILKD